MVPSIAFVPNEFPFCWKKSAPSPSEEVEVVPTIPFVAYKTPVSVLSLNPVVVRFVVVALVAVNAPTVSVSIVEEINRPIDEKKFVEVALIETILVPVALMKVRF